MLQPHSLCPTNALEYCWQISISVWSAYTDSNLDERHDSEKVQTRTLYETVSLASLSVNTIGRQALLSIDQAAAMDFATGLL